MQHTTSHWNGLANTVTLKDVAVVEVSSLKDVNVDDRDEGMGRLAEFTPLGEPNGLSMKFI